MDRVINGNKIKKSYIPENQYLNIFNHVSLSKITVLTKLYIKKMYLCKIY